MRQAFVLLVAIASLLLTTPLTYSQDYCVGQTKVDFDFQVGRVHLPAGEYSVKYDPMSWRVTIWNVQTNERALVFTRRIINNSKPIETKLVFQKNGDTCVLHKVWSERLGHRL